MRLPSAARNNKLTTDTIPEVSKYITNKYILSEIEKLTYETTIINPKVLWPIVNKEGLV